MLGVLTCNEEEGESFGKPVTRWRYQLASEINPDVLDPDTVPDLSLHKVFGEKERDEIAVTHTDISGTEPGGATKEVDDADDCARF